MLGVSLEHLRRLITSEFVWARQGFEIVEEIADQRVYKLTTEYVGEFSNSTPELMSSMRT